MGRCILGIDQSTQGTKVLLFDARGDVIKRLDKPHRQYVDARGWVEHDPEEIWENLKELVGRLLQETRTAARDIAAIGISNQRETALAWDKATGKSIYHAIVWQCARGAQICTELEEKGCGDRIRQVTGLPLSPYFSAAKLAWLLRHVEGARKLMAAGRLAMGTMDSWLVYKMTGGRRFQTDASNASRTQLFDIEKLQWSEEVAGLFGIETAALPLVTDSDGDYGETDFDGLLDRKIPIRGVLGDSHAALFGQGCHRPGLAKATYGTGSSVMMNVGADPVRSAHGLVTSLAWSLGGRPEYVLEGNINYTGAAISWLKDDLKLIESAGETEALARAAHPEDKSYFVPAFTGLGAPYWESGATGLFTGLTRVTGKREMVRAVLDAIAYQINDIVSLMQEESGHQLPALYVDGGPTKNGYLMQRTADIIAARVEVPDVEELSAMGAAYVAGIAAGLYERREVFARGKRRAFSSQLSAAKRAALIAGWRAAIRQVLSATRKPQ